MDAGALCGNRTHILALEGRCSAVELIARLERAAGIEPPLAAWKVAVLPLYYARRLPGGIAAPLWRVALRVGAPSGMELMEGFEPPTR